MSNILKKFYNNLKRTGHGPVEVASARGTQIRSWEYEVRDTRPACLTKFIMSTILEYLTLQNLQVNQTNLQSGLNSFSIGNHEVEGVQPWAAFSLDKGFGLRGVNSLNRL